MIKLIIFDWDDVITIGSKEGYFACHSQTLQQLGVKLSESEFKKRMLENWGKTHVETWKALLKEHPVLFEKACKLYVKKLFSDFSKHISVLPNTRELLQKLSKKYILCVVTGMDGKLLREKVIPDFKIPAVFSTIIPTSEIKNPAHYKPSPYMVHLLLKKYHLHPSEAIVVGDGKNDVLMAQNADVMPIVVLSGNLTEKEAKELGVKLIIKDVTYLEDVLTNI